MRDPIRNYAMLDFVAQKIARVSGVEAASVAPDGGINAITANGIDRRLREEILSMGQRAMVPVRVFYRMPDGAVIGENEALKVQKALKREAIEDYYTPIFVDGFAGSKSEAPPEEVAAETDGALKLKRVRSKTRGRPVVAWKYGEKTVRRGMEIKFNKACSLAWTLGRTLNIKPGASAKVMDLATKRPVAYVSLGEYDSVELPIHMLGTTFDVLATGRPKATGEHKAIDDKLGYLGPELKRIIQAVGFGRAPGSTDTADNTANWSPDGTDSPDPYIPASTGEDGEDMISSPDAMDPSQSDDRFIQRRKEPKNDQPKLVLGRK
jgi:hypothetical protein